MDDVKSALASKTIWGGIVAGLAPVLGLLGVTLSAEDQATLINGMAAIGSLIGMVIVVYGRMRATSRIGGVVTPDPAKAPAPTGPVAPTIIRP